MPELLIIRVPHQQEAAVALKGEPLVIGSNPSSHIVVNDPAVLPHHAYLAKDQGHWRVAAYDANVPLNYEDQPTTDLRLENGTRFSIGHTQFEFTTDGAEPEHRTRELGSFVPERRAGAAAASAVANGENPVLDNPEAAVAQLHQAMQRIRSEMARVVIGQAEVVNQILVALFARGHCLLVGTPGLAKTLMARTLADSLELQCKRVQFTPDLMPADITGTQVLEQDPVTPRATSGSSTGPIFTNLLLADEINRTPPKTQAALLEAMQERRVTISGQTYDLPVALLRHRHAKSDRAGRDLSAARGATRPLHVQRQGRLSRAPRRRSASSWRRRRTPRRKSIAFSAAEALIGFPASRAQDAGEPACRRLRHAAGPRHAARCARRARLHQELGALGRRSARRAISASSPRNPTRSCRAGSTFPATTCAPMLCPCCAIASSAISPRPARASIRTKLCGAWSRPFPNPITPRASSRRRDHVLRARHRSISRPAWRTRFAASAFPRAGRCRAASRACTARPISAPRSSSPSTAITSRATRPT